MIIGCAGSGKTTLSFKLHKKLNVPLIHLDQHYWKPGWQRSSLDEFAQIHDELCWQDEWIMEGSYMNVFSSRVVRSDVIIFLDLPRYLCLWRVLKRTICNFGKVIPGSPNSPQQPLSLNFWNFLKWIWNFNRRYRNMILTILNLYKDHKDIYILRSPKEIENFYERL